MRNTFVSLGASFSPLFGNSTVALKGYYALKSLLTRRRRRNIEETLNTQFNIKTPIKFLDHHLCHAASAYFTSGYEDATVITMDGAGDHKCARVYRVRKGRFEPLQDIDSYHSIGNYYAYVTHLCGYKAHKHEGKITGLAAFGKPIYLDILRKYISYTEGVIKNKGKCFDNSAITKLASDLPDDFSHAELSASIQVLLEETVATFCDWWIKQSGIWNVALAGGVFANVKLNQRVHELEAVENMFIHPGMGDEGLAVGAALFEHNQRAGYQYQPVISNVYFGADFNDADIELAVRKANCELISFDGPIERKIAELLADGKVVARFSGRMEYGPRALGNRTIMYKPTDPTVNDWLNKRLVRTEFMPFAPVTLKEFTNQCYKDTNGAGIPARFMTITFDCTDWMKKNCPAVVHIDGTARPQIIDKDKEPEYYKIVDEYRKITGLPSVINTSFNMHEEPIVCTPRDAIRAYKDGHLDCLAIGNFLLSNEQD